MWEVALNRGVTSKQDSGYTVVGIMDDGAELNETVSKLRELGVTGEDLTVILKREDPDEPEPFPEGTRYIIIPDDSRGLEIAVGFAAIFVISGLLFAFTTPEIGLILFMFFIALAAILVVATFIRVGVTPILIDVGAPAEESGFWNDEFEKGRILLFASTADRRSLKPIWEVFQERGAYFDIVGRRLSPQPVNEAVLHWATPEGSERREEEYPEKVGEG
jgi:hypothetical protein